MFYGRHTRQFHCSVMSQKTAGWTVLTLTRCCVLQHVIWGLHILLRSDCPTTLGYYVMNRNVRKHSLRCAPNEDSDHPAHLRSVFRIFTVHIFNSQDCKVSSCGQKRLIGLLGCANSSTGTCCAHVRRYVFWRCGSYIIAGTEEERGIKKWRKLNVNVSSAHSDAIKTYDLPFIQKYLDKYRFSEYLPFCPTFSMKCNWCKSRDGNSSSNAEKDYATKDGKLSSENPEVIQNTGTRL